MAYGKGSVNKVTLLGRLGKDPELKYLPNGTAVANFSIATTLAWQDQAKETKEQTEWHRLVAWRNQAETANKFLRKGSQVFIEGRLQTRSWDDKESGKKCYTTEVVVENLVLIGSKGDGSGSSTPEPTEEFPSASAPVERPVGAGAAPAPSDEDSLPF